VPLSSFQPRILGSSVRSGRFISRCTLLRFL
jgi:hypothetical protein